MNIHICLDFKWQIKMTTLCIIRHGETDWNNEGRFQGIEEIPLNNNGRKQALSCVKYLKNFEWDAIVTSPLGRAKETASIIANNLGFKTVKVIPELIERDFGRAAGLFPHERKKMFPNELFEGAETKEATRKRSMEALKIIDNMYKDKRVIVITHGGIINSIMNVLTNSEFSTKAIRIKNASITILKGSQYSWDIELFNHTESTAYK